MKHTPEASHYISHEPTDEIIYVRLEDGKIDLSIFLSNECDSSTQLLAAMQAWVTDAAPVIIAPHFTVAAPVDYLISGHEMPAYNNHIDIDAKPIFSALRAEMMAQIERIDALVFEAST